MEAITTTEHIIEHIAHDIGKDPLSVRMRNLDKKYPIENLIKEIKEKSDYDSRKAGVDTFNKVRHIICLFEKKQLISYI